MGYYYTVDPENTVPPKSRATPKTHVPGSPVKERGHRYFMPEVGKWGSRDPIAEEGGMNLYGFIMNRPIDDQDVLGLAPGGSPRWGRTIHTPPGSTIGDGRLGYNFSMNISRSGLRIPAQSHHTWQANHGKSTINYYSPSSYGGAWRTALLDDYKIDILDLRSARNRYTPPMQWEDQSGWDPYNSGNLSSFWASLLRGQKSICKVVRTMTKKQGFSNPSINYHHNQATMGGHVISYTANASDYTDVDGNMLGPTDIMTYTYTYENWNDCECVDYFESIGFERAQPILGSSWIPGVFESLDVPGYPRLNKSEWFFP